MIGAPLIAIFRCSGSRDSLQEPCLAWGFTGAKNHQPIRF